MHNNVNINVSGPIQPSSIYKTVVLKGNLPFALQVTEPNTKYVIKHNFNLEGESVTIPEGCLLEFDGGAIYNGTLAGQSTILIYHQELDDIFHNITRQGTFVYNNTLSADEESLTEQGNLVSIKDKGIKSKHIDDNQILTKHILNESITGDKLNPNVVDDEDIHFTVDHKLQLKDKAYTPSNYSGMGRVYLRKNIVNGVNTLTQDMFYKGEVGSRVPNTNTIFVIQYDYDLNDPDGENPITIPDNCVLEFEGGSLSNGKLIGNNTKLRGLKDTVLFNNCIPIGFVFPYIDVRWFGAVSDYDEKTNTGTDNSQYFKKVFDLIGQYYNGTYINLIGQYLIETPVITKYDIFIKGHHVTSRNLFSSNIDKSDISSPSLIVVGAGITAFTTTGRFKTIEEEKNYGFAVFSIENIKVLGIDRYSSNFLNYSATGPSRVSNIHQCEFTYLHDIVTLPNNEEGHGWDTLLCDITISECIAYNNNKLFVAKSIENKRTIGNFILKDSNIEQNRTNFIDIENSFGAIIITNNILESQDSPFRIINCRNAQVEISHNYFEANTGFSTISGEGKSSLVLFENFVSSNELGFNITGFKIEQWQSGLLSNNSILNYVVFECIPSDFNLNWIADNKLVFFLETLANTDTDNSIGKDYPAASDAKLKEYLALDLNIANKTLTYGAVNEGDTIFIKAINNGSTTNDRNHTVVIKIDDTVVGNFAMFGTPNLISLRGVPITATGNLNLSLSGTAKLAGFKVYSATENPSIRELLSIKKINNFGTIFSVPTGVKDGDSYLDYNTKKIKTYLNGKWYSGGFAFALSTGTTANRPTLTDLRNPADVGYAYYDTDIKKTIYFKEVINNNIRWVEQDGASAGVVRSGESTNRPTSSSIYVGFMYFDTTLGKPIWWNGTAWVDATGATV